MVAFSGFDDCSRRSANYIAGYILEMPVNAHNRPLGDMIRDPFFLAGQADNAPHIKAIDRYAFGDPEFHIKGEALYNALCRIANPERLSYKDISTVQQCLLETHNIIKALKERPTDTDIGEDLSERRGYFNEIYAKFRLLSDALEREYPGYSFPLYDQHQHATAR